MDLATLANLIQAIAVVVGVVFGFVQLRQLKAQRRRESAFALMQSSLSPQILRAVLIIDHLPETPEQRRNRRATEKRSGGCDRAPDHLGRPRHSVFNHEIPLRMIDDFYSGTVAQSWRKLQRYVEQLREASSRPTDWEWFEWLAERMQEEESARPPVLAHVQHRNWKRSS